MTIADKIMFFCWASMMALLLCDCFTYDEKLAYALIMTTLALVYFIEILIKEHR